MVLPQYTVKLKFLLAFLFVALFFHFWHTMTVTHHSPNVTYKQNFPGKRVTFWWACRPRGHDKKSFLKSGLAAHTKKIPQCPKFIKRILRTPNHSSSFSVHQMSWLKKVWACIITTFWSCHHFDSFSGVKIKM